MARLAHFELGGTLSARGSGSVVRVRDLRDGNELALRRFELSGVSEALREEVLHRYRREAELVGRLRLPPVYGVKEAGHQEGTLWVTVPLPPGAPAVDFTGGAHRLEPRRLVRVILALARALDQAQRAGIVHCDVDPENVLLSEGDRVALLDFGMARMSDPRRGLILGSPRTISPEQMRDGHPGASSNQFALGVLTFHLLTGAWPFPGRDAGEIEQEILHGEPEPLSRHRPELPGGVGRALARALHREPANRFPGTLDFAESFEKGFDEETVLPPREPSIESGIWERTPRPKRGTSPAPVRLPSRASRSLPRWLKVLLGSVVVLLLLIGARQLWSSGWMRERRVARLLDSGDLPGAAAALRDWKAHADPAADPRLAVVEADLDCARRDLAGCAAACLRAVKRDPPLAASPRIQEHVLSALDSKPAHPSLVALAPLLPGSVEQPLWGALQADSYWRRWNAARMLEARGLGERVDWVGLYLLDLENGPSCAVRRGAAKHLGAARDPRSLPAIEAARHDPKARPCKLGTTLEAAAASLSAP